MVPGMYIKRRHDILEAIFFHHHDWTQGHVTSARMPGFFMPPVHLVMPFVNEIDERL